MKAIYISPEDIKKAGNKQSSKRKFDIRIAYKQLLKKHQEQKTLFVKRIQTFLAFFDVFDRIQCLLYIFIGLGIIGTLTFTLPALAHFYELQNTILESENTITRLSEEIESLKNIAPELQSIQGDIALIHQAIPQDATEEDIILTLGSLLMKHRLSSPNRFVWQREKVSSIVDENLTENYDVYSYNFATQGDFSDIMNFLGDIRKNLRIIDVKSIQMIPLASGIIDSSITIWTYNHKHTS